MPSDVLYVLRYYPAVSETFVARELAELRRQGVRVTVISMGQRPDAAFAAPVEGIEVLHLPRGRHRIPAVLRHPRPTITAVRVAWAVHAARQRGVSRVHAHFAGEAALLARQIARELRVPYSVTVHAADLFKPIPGLSELLAEARPCIAVCAHHRRWIARRYGVEAVVVRCGIEVGGRPLASPGVQPGRVVCVARPVPKKGLDRLRRAVPPERLEILGADHPVRPEQVPARLAAAQVFALPAQVATDGDRDGVPVSMLEAMAAGLPVVSRPVSGIPELVDASVGWISEDFEGALAAALADPEERVRRGLAGRARVQEHWRLEQSVASLRAAWGRLLP